MIAKRSIFGGRGGSENTSPHRGSGGFPSGLALCSALTVCIVALFATETAFAFVAEPSNGNAAHATDPAVFRLAIFVMAIFVGYYVVWSVTPALHTPLMSVTNAISSVIVVGALLATAVPAVEGASWTAKLFGFLALAMASVNIFGGFLVTQRMLSMYQKKAK